jgi:hypothetical protein
MEEEFKHTAKKIRKFNEQIKFYVWYHLKHLIQIGSKVELVMF